MKGVAVVTVAGGEVDDEVDGETAAVVVAAAVCESYVLFVVLQIVSAC